jgi:hypothetical protein
MIIKVNAALILALKLVFVIILGITTISLASEEVSSLAKKVMSGVVLIQTYDSNGNELGQGSGFIISKDGDVVTCYHVMRGYSRAIVTTSDEKKFQVRNITAINKSDDLARISLSTTEHNFNNLELNMTMPDVGQEIIAVGGPLGLENTVSQGIISAIRENTIQITAPVSPGSSGGPVLNMKGEVIGIVSAQMKIGQNLNFAIPAYLISIMQPASAEQVKELLEPFYSTEVESADTPLWKKWGYPSEEVFVSKNEARTLSGAYFYECSDRFFSKQKYNEAIQCCDYILDANPSFHLAWYLKGLAFYYLTRYDIALICFNESIELDPLQSAYWQNKGATLKKLHRDSEAKDAFAKANSKIWKEQAVMIGVYRGYV